MDKIEIRAVDYSDSVQATQLVTLMNDYASDPMGGGKPLPQEVIASLAAEMNDRPHVNSAIAYVDGQAAGLINYVEGFSTFAAKSLLNIHDVIVSENFRRRGIAAALFGFVEAEAAKMGCCKVTLEVLELNEPACLAYRKFGFEPYQLTPTTGAAQFWQKKLPKA
jgi:ribosomal protein S18 acetylase RimI-like enzyme